MSSLVTLQIDPVARTGDTGDQCLDDPVVVPDEREHGAVVILVCVDVENVCVVRKRCSQCIDRVAVTSLGEVRNRLERQLHGRTLGGP